MKREVVGGVTVKIHWQEPAVFSLTLPLLSAAASERNSKWVKGVQSKWKELKLVKRSSRRTEAKVMCERIRESDKSKVRKEGARREEVCVNGCRGRFVCYSSLYVCFVCCLCLEKIQGHERREELNFEKNWILISNLV